VSSNPLLYQHLEAVFKDKHGVWDPILGLTITLSYLLVNSEADSGIGLSYLPASLSYLGGRYDNPIPESAISPSQGLRIWPRFPPQRQRMHTNVSPIISKKEQAIGKGRVKEGERLGTDLKGQ
jgi:hypothetical protein